MIFHFPVKSMIYKIKAVVPKLDAGAGDKEKVSCCSSSFLLEIIFFHLFSSL